MRKKQRVFSPVYIKSKYLIKYQNNNEFDTFRMNDNFLRTMDEGFYSTRNIKKKNKFQSVQEVDNINYNLNSNTINIDKSYFGINNCKKNSSHNYNEIIPTLSQKGFECFLPETVIKVNKTNNTNNSKIYNNNVLKQHINKPLQNKIFMRNNTNDLDMNRNTVNYLQSKNNYIKNKIYGEDFEKQNKINKNKYDNLNPKVNNYNYIESNNNNEEEENDYKDTSEKNELTLNNENNELEEDNSENETESNKSKLKEVVVDNINEIYQNSEYEEYYNNIKLKNDSENNSNKAYKNVKYKGKEMTLNKKYKKNEKQKPKNSNLNFKNLKIEKNRITIKIKKKNNENNFFNRTNSNYFKKKPI